MSGEFASAAMVRVLTQGMRELGIPLPAAGGLVEAEAQATVGLDQKQALVGHAMAHGGLACLVALGRGVHRHAHEPTHRAMTSAGSPLELFERWRRLERYIHSTHRTSLKAPGPRGVTLVHGGVRPEVLPALPESLVVIGVLGALLEALGVQAVQVHLGRRRIYPDPKETTLRRLPTRDASRAWRFSWAAPVAPASSPPPPMAGWMPEPAPAWVQALGRHLMEDPMRPPSLAEAADRLGQSTRSLQRGLKTLGLSFTTLAAQARTRHAAWHLIETGLSLAEIGFLCGYADQAHFTRDFGRRVGLSPERYRVAFRRVEAVAADQGRSRID